MIVSEESPLFDAIDSEEYEDAPATVVVELPVEEAPAAVDEPSNEDAPAWVVVELPVDEDDDDDSADEDSADKGGDVNLELDFDFDFDFDFDINLNIQELNIGGSGVDALASKEDDSVKDLLFLKEEKTLITENGSERELV